MRTFHHNEFSASEQGTDTLWRAGAVAAVLAAEEAVIAAGLNLNFRRETFGPMGDLLALATEVISLSAYCALCGAPTNLTYRKSSDTEEIIIGVEMYQPRCRDCWNKQ
jgi:thymidine kinase